MLTIEPKYYGLLKSVNLNEVYRKGWLLRGIPMDKCESVEDHTDNTAKGAFYYTSDSKLVKMMLVHDFPEKISGDTTPFDGVTDDAKYALELNAMDKISSKFDKPIRGEIMGLWLEYSQRKTSRAIIGHQLDKLDATVKAIYYENLGYNVNALSPDFYLSTRKILSDSKLITVFDELMKNKSKLIDPHTEYFLLLSNMNINQ